MSACGDGATLPSEEDSRILSAIPYLATSLCPILSFAGFGFNLFGQTFINSSFAVAGVVASGIM